MTFSLGVVPFFLFYRLQGVPFLFFARDSFALFLSFLPSRTELRTFDGPLSFDSFSAQRLFLFRLFPSFRKE